MLRVCALAAACLLGMATLAHAGPAAPIHVTGGDIAGADDGKVRTWFGVPYAAPPVGDLRWREPQPVVPWTGVKGATTFSPACAQTATWIPEPKSEDCLYLNIWAPEKAHKLPVIVWIHGGGFYGGTGAQPLYDGTNLTKHGVVVVTLNYRLGIFGFFAHPELAAESPDHTSGNQGIQDQIAALKWVRANIAAFGGDPRRVTIMGESAGGESVAILVASPEAKGLFQRAIAESGNDAMPLDPSEAPQFDRAAAEAQGEAFMRAVGANDLSALRGMSAHDVEALDWSPRVIVDGHVLREDLTATYRNHRQNDVPLLVGWNAEEGKDLAPEILGTSDFTAANFEALATKLLGHAPSKALLAAYPATTDAEARASINRLTNDWWGWRMVTWARLHAENSRSPAYVYYFTHTPTEPATPCGYGCGVGHGVEIQYVFDNLDKDPRPWSDADRHLSTDLAGRWATFAATGVPNGGSTAIWPIFDGSNASIRTIGNDADMKAHPLPDLSVFSDETARRHK